MTGVGLSLKSLFETPYGQKTSTMYEEDLQGLKEVSQFLPCSIASAFLSQSTGWDKSFDNNNNTTINCESWDRVPYTNNTYQTPADTQNQPFTLDYMDMNKFLEDNDIKDTSFLSLYQPGSNCGNDMFDAHNNQRCTSLCSSNPSTPRSDMPSPSSPGLTSPSSPESACYSVDYQYDFAPFIIKGSESSYLAPCKWSSQTSELKPPTILRKSKKTFVPEDMKDTRYWSRRRKNNLAAKRSRDARRIKENQVAMRATFLEMQNNNLMEEIEQLRVENMRLKQKLNKYEA